MPPRHKRGSISRKQSCATKTATTKRKHSEQLCDENGDTDTEPDEQLFNISGNFEKDFTQLCHLHGVEWVPPVVSRPRRPYRPDEGKKPASGRSSGQKMSNEKQEDLTDSFQPSTFTQTDRLSFFRPCVQVEYQKVEEAQQVTEIYIRGWKVDGTMINVLKYCCILLAEHLTLLQLWNVGLTADTVDILSSFLPCCLHLTTLLLDTNSLGEDADLFRLIDEPSPVVHLSLRFCRVMDQGARGLGSALGNMQNWNRKLLTLNLSNNCITDVGARHLAEGLRTNRTLLVLNLDNNQIGDEGAATLARVLSNIALNQEQIKFRRWIFSERKRTLSLSVPKIRFSHCRQDHVNRKNEDMSASKRKKSTTEKKNGKNSLTKRKVSSRLEPQPKGSLSKDRQSVHLQSFMDFSQELNGHSKSSVDFNQELSRHSKTSVDFSKELSNRSQSKESMQIHGLLEAAPFEWHPLAEPGSLDEEDQFVIVGNRSLVSLSLARNHIGKEGLRHMLTMLQVQANSGPEQGVQQRGPHHLYYQQQNLLQQQPQPPPCCSFTGLKRLVLHTNAVTTDNEVLMKIQEIMVSRNPMAKPPLLPLQGGSV